MHFDLPELIKQIGYLGIFAIVFAESGLLIGFFLPGDSLLFTAGFLASQMYEGKPILNVGILYILCLVAAISGDSVGYYFGKRTGKKIFSKEDSLLFNKSHIDKAEKFYEAHGGKTIILARFMPVIRTFAPIVAGAGNMKYSSFIFYNVIGGFIWVTSMVLGGYFLGRLIPDVDKYLLPIIVVIILISAGPGIYHFFKEKSNRVKLAELIRTVLKKIKKTQ
ncbi:MAG: VTT domain-containing protein [bacterium]|nr:VTT domain-containing protein [bacterium]